MDPSPAPSDEVPDLRADVRDAVRRIDLTLLEAADRLLVGALAQEGGKAPAG
jgi:hypothetical protein